MRLRTLIAEGAVPLRLVGDGEIDVTGLCLDSRAARPGDLFLALRGTRAAGEGFAAEALARGAVAVLGGPGLAARPWPVPVVIADDPRRAAARTAAAFYGRQPATVVAVTGTSGKTSVATFARELWAGLGRRAASLGTLGLELPGEPAIATLTTPDALTLHRLLARAAAAGVEALALEASSHGLDQRRLDGVRLRAAAFTNLSRDHFDYHGTVEAYRAAKLRLFDTLLPPGAAAVINADVPENVPLRALARERGLPVIDYGRAAASLRLLACAAGLDGLDLRVAAGGRELRVRSRLVGAFQAHNLLAAAGLVIAGGEPPDAVLPLLAALRGAPGRMEAVARHPAGAVAFVDYAHKPEALRQALGTLRAGTPGRLTVVFGCGGDRDPGKRPEMGRIAAAGADRVIVTDDNPRSEPPAAIRAAVLAGAPGAEEIGERAEAIAAAFRALAAGDALLVAGKGHETGQYVGERVLPFDDAAALRACALAAGGTVL